MKALLGKARTVALATVLTLGGGALWILHTGSGARAGDALELDDGAVVSFSGGERHVDQELTIVFEGFANESSSPIEITGITFDDLNIHNVEFIEIGLIPREVGGYNFVAGTYQSSPPTFMFDDRCLSHEIEPLEQRLDPGESYLLAYHVKFPGRGPYRFVHPRIHYRSGSSDFYETLRVELWGNVKDTRYPVPVDVIEAPCVDEDDLLPGNSMRKP